MGRTVTGWGSRAVALALLISMNACLKDDSGSSQSSVGPGAATPLSDVWRDQSTAATGSNADTPLSDVWVDATTVTASGNGAILPSIDEVTYGFPTVYTINPPPSADYLLHQLMVHSSARAVLDPEDQILTLINNYRLQTLGQGNLGGVGGIGGVGGVGGVGGQQITALPPSGKLRKNARAHCKHYARWHAGNLPQGPNIEQDDINSGGVNPTGRLRKSKVTVSAAVQYSLSAPAYSTAQFAFDQLVSTNSPILTSIAYSYIGIGHWPQGDPLVLYYWNFVLGNGVNPVN